MTSLNSILEDLRTRMEECSSNEDKALFQIVAEAQRAQKAVEDEAKELHDLINDDSLSESDFFNEIMQYAVSLVAKRKTAQTLGKTAKALYGKICLDNTSPL